MTAESDGYVSEAHFSDVIVTDERCRQLAAQSELDVKDWCDLTGVGSGRYELYLIDAKSVRFIAWSESYISASPNQEQNDLRRENETPPLIFPCSGPRLLDFIDNPARVETFFVPDAFREEVARLARAAEEEVRRAEAEFAALDGAGSDQSQTNAKKSRVKQSDRVKKVLQDCRERADKLGEIFDERKMPGQKLDFLQLLHRMDTKLRSVKTVASLDNHLGGLCAWPNDASANTSAIPLYRRLFPEYFEEPGVNQDQRKRT